MATKILRTKSKRYTLATGNLFAKKILSLPEDCEVIKVFSSGDLNSINFIFLVAAHTKINELTASTLRVGKKEIYELNRLHKKGKLEKATFIFSSIMRRAGKVERGYNYYNEATKICDANGWDIIEQNNHSKIILLDTEIGKYVLETSSNLNENPKNEQFSFEKSEELYDWYYDILRR